MAKTIGTIGRGGDITVELLDILFHHLVKRLLRQQAEAIASLLVAVAFGYGLAGYFRTA
jgi:hypothetical protein